MNSPSYHISKTKKEKETLNLEIDKLKGYQVNPKVKEDNAIRVDKILFTNADISEKIIRKKIDSKIDYLLYKLKFLETDDGNVYVENGEVTNGKSISYDELESKNYYISNITKKNDLALKYNYFKKKNNEN